MKTIELKIKLHPAQNEIRKANARFAVVAAGRRFGKTRLGVGLCLQCAVNGGVAWWVAPSYKMSEVGWKPLVHAANQLKGLAEIRQGDKIINFPGGGSVAVRSADNPQSLRGQGLDFLVMDECAFIQKEAWTEALRPSLSDKQGKALFISTPKGRNWFWEIYQRNDGEWRSFHYPTASNPYIKASEIEAAKLDLPELIFRQEFLAEFIDDSGSVFRRVQDNATAEEIISPIPGRTYAAAVDVAQSVDYTVCTVMDTASKRMVYLDRFNRCDYPVLEDRLAAMYAKWKLQSMTVESNSIGQPVIDHLQQRGLNIRRFTTSQQSKQTIIQGLQSAFEHDEIKIIPNPVLIAELLSFESKRTTGGAYSYSAPDGLHDDTVMSLAMAWNAIKSGEALPLYFGSV